MTLEQYLHYRHYRVSDAGGYALVVNEKNLADVDWMLDRIEKDVGYQKHEP